MTDLDIRKECRQTGKTSITTKKLLEKGYYEQMIKQMPPTDYIFSEEAQKEFDEWFQGQYGTYGTRGEYFYTDCETEDEEYRNRMMYLWIQTAFRTGYERGRSANCPTETL